MNLALVLQHRIASALQLWFGSKLPARSGSGLGSVLNADLNTQYRPNAGSDIHSDIRRDARSACRSVSRLDSGHAPRVSRPHGSRNSESPCAPSASKPLRIVRVVENGQSRSASGRMVISGRMADVCAELDRLVAREAAAH